MPLLAVACLAAAGAWAANVDGAPADVLPLRTLYESHLAQIESEFSAEMDQWVQDYRREVSQLAVTSQRAGNLENWQAATAEVARFAETPQLPDETPADAPDAIRTLHARHRETVAACGQRRTKKADDLTARYLARLGALQADATRAGKLESALAYNAECKRVQAIQAARLPPATPTTAPAVATAVTPPLGEAQPPTPPAGAEPPSNATAVPAPPDGVVISEGRTPPPVANANFKPLTLSMTDRMRVARRLSVQAEQSSSAEVERTTYMRSGTAQRIVRLGLRSATTAQTIEGAKLVVQFYGKDAESRGSHVVPKAVGIQRVSLPRLDAARWVFVQLSAVATESTTYRSSYFYTSSRYGMEYYGAIINVFDASDTLIYQAVTAPNLAPLAPDRMPPDPPPLPSSSRTVIGFDGIVVP
jgi:hypothetical protein